MHGDHSGRLLLVPYDTLVADPAAALDAIYRFTGVAPFRHDFDDVTCEAREFDARLGTPGLHDVRPVERRTVLPPDLWERDERAGIWRAPEFNTAGTPVAGEPAAAP